MNATVEKRLSQFGFKLIHPGDQMPENQSLVFPDLVKPGMENPAPENPGLEIPTQINTEESNTEELKTDISNIFTAEAGGFGKKKKFEEPTVGEVEEYCREHELSVDAELFVNYYTANGWHIGRSKMKNWKSAVICWSKNGGRDPGKAEKKERRLGNFDTKDFFEAALRRSYGERMEDS